MQQTARAFVIALRVMPDVDSRTEVTDSRLGDTQELRGHRLRQAASLDQLGSRIIKPDRIVGVSPAPLKIVDRHRRRVGRNESKDCAVEGQLRLQAANDGLGSAKAMLFACKR